MITKGGAGGGVGEESLADEGERLFDEMSSAQPPHHAGDPMWAGYLVLRDEILDCIAASWPVLEAVAGNDDNPYVQQLVRMAVDEISGAVDEIFNGEIDLEAREKIFRTNPPAVDNDLKVRADVKKVVDDVKRIVDFLKKRVPAPLIEFNGDEVPDPDYNEIRGRPIATSGVGGGSRPPNPHNTGPRGLNNALSHGAQLGFNLGGMKGGGGSLGSGSGSYGSGHGGQDSQTVGSGGYGTGYGGGGGLGHDKADPGSGSNDKPSAPSPGEKPGSGPGGGGGGVGGNAPRESPTSSPQQQPQTQTPSEDQQTDDQQSQDQGSEEEASPVEMVFVNDAGESATYTGEPINDEPSERVAQPSDVANSPPDPPPNDGGGGSPNPDDGTANARLATPRATTRRQVHGQGRGSCPNLDRVPPPRIQLGWPRRRWRRRQPALLRR